MVIEFSSSVVSPSFIHTVSFVVISLSMFADMLSSDDAFRDMLESEMTTTAGLKGRQRGQMSLALRSKGAPRVDIYLFWIK